jgi:hypothetical protein
MTLLIKTETVAVKSPQEVVQRIGENFRKSEKTGR